MNEYSNAPIGDMVVASFEQVKGIAESQQARIFIWEDEPQDSAILVDWQTAHLLVEMYRMVNQPNKLNIERMISTNSDRFYKLVEFCWQKHFESTDKEGVG